MPSARSRPCEEKTIQSVRAAGDCAASAKPWVLLATILASSIAYVDESIVNVALPAIETDLSASVTVIQWLINAYTLTLSSLLLVGGAAGDRFGRRRLFIIGISIFAVASLWCGISPSTTQLISARAVQGVGAALLIPSSLAIIGATFPENERGKAIGTWAGFSALAAAAGPLLGGWIVDHFSWRWIFFVNPFLAVPTVLVALYHVPESRDPEAKPGLDWQGALLVLIGLGSITYGLIALPILKWSDPIVLASISVGLILLGAFVWVEGHSRAPMLPLTMFRSRVFSVINILTLLLYGALGGTFFFLPFALIQVRGYPATLAGAAFLPFTIIMAGLSRWAGGLLDTFGPRLPLVIGPAISALGLGLIASIVVSGPYWVFFIPIIILGFGMVISVAPLTTTVINSVPAHQTGTASGINNAVASVANLFAVALLGAVALGILNHALDRRLQGATLSSGVQQAIQTAHGNFVIEPALSKIQGADRVTAETIIKGSLTKSIRSVMLIAAVLALSAAAVGTLLPRSYLSVTGAIAAVVFDLDGVLVDSESVWDAARREVVSRNGGCWQGDATRAMMGMSSPEWSRYMRDQLGVPLEPKKINELVIAALLDQYRRRLPLLPGAVVAVRRLADRWPLALASSANRPVIDAVLEQAGISDCFAVTVSGEEVAAGKPAPDVYLAAARRLGVDPGDAVAVEDSTNGLRSAAAAGMVVIASPNREYPPEPDALALAAMVVTSLDELTPDAIESAAQRAGKHHA